MFLKSTQTIRTLYVFVTLLISTLFCKAQPQKLPVTHLSIFGNQIGSVIKSGSLRFDDHRAVVEVPTEAIPGTFQIIPTSEYQITKAYTAKDTITVPAIASDFFEILKANVGSQAEIHFQIGNEVDVITGEVLYYMPQTEIIAVRKNSGNTMFLRKKQILQVSIQGNAKLSYEEKILGDSYTIEIDKDVTFAPVSIQYLEKGYSWKPEYQYQILNEKEGVFTLLAWVKTTTEALQDAELILSLSTPRIETNEKTLDIRNPQVFAAATVSLPTNSNSRVILEQINMSHTEAVEVKIPELLISPESPRLAKKLPMNAYKVVRTENKTGRTFPPAELLVLDAQRNTISQENFMQWNISQKTSFKTAIIPSIEVSVTEEERSREVKSLKTATQSFDKVIIKGTILLKNTDSKKVSIEVQKIVAGNVLRSLLGSFSKQDSRWGMNNMNLITWPISLMPNLPLTLNYEYEVFLPTAHE